MLRSRKWLIVSTLLLLTMVVVFSTASAAKCNVQGLVFIDTNENGVWDAGEAGYGGEYLWDADEEEMRYMGAEITVITPAYDEFELESAGHRELDENEEDLCCYQDYVVDDEINETPRRPCDGTFGLPIAEENVRLEVWVTAPEGYRVTSPNPQYVTTDVEMVPVDFGIAPYEAVAMGGPLPEIAPVVELEAVAAPMPAIVEGTGFVPGMVFIDTNQNGVWDIGEAGYGGELTWIEKDNEMRYVGATIVLISPAYDEFELTSAGYRELEEGEVIPCSQQDLVYDGDLNLHPVRPCVGTWGLPHAGDDIRWEVWLMTPAGYKVTSQNPQYFTTGHDSVPVDFGIAPID